MSCDPLAFRGVVREPPRRQGQAPAGSHADRTPTGVEWLFSHPTLSEYTIFILHGTNIHLA